MRRCLKVKMKIPEREEAGRVIGEMTEKEAERIMTETETVRRRKERKWVEERKLLGKKLTSWEWMGRGKRLFLLTPWPLSHVHFPFNRFLAWLPVPPKAQKIKMITSSNEVLQGCGSMTNQIAKCTERFRGEASNALSSVIYRSARAVKSWWCSITSSQKWSVWYVWSVILCSHTHHFRADSLLNQWKQVQISGCCFLLSFHLYYGKYP